VAAVAVLLGAIAFARPRLAGVAKMAASTGFLATALAAGGAGTAHGTVILFGLLCSWWGDLFLISRARRVFLCGIVAFLLGHLAYAAAFLQLGVEWPWVGAALLPLGAAVLLVLRWLGTGLGRLRAAVHAYVAVITAMLALALGAAAAGAPVVLLPAALLFYVSDLFVARERFVASGRFNRLAGLPLYYAGQLLFAWGAGLPA
jgi:uncharacterized membrane protein YhhN